MQRRSSAIPVLLAALGLLCACTVQTGTIPDLPETSTGEAVLPASQSGASASDTELQETAPEPAATTIDSLEVPVDADVPAAVTGHLIISTIGFGNTPEKDGPPRMLEFFDYDCEYCRQHALEERRWMDERYVAAGRMGIERVFVAMTPAGKRMDQAALCAAVQGAFTPMDTFLLANVPQSDFPIFAFAKTLEIDQTQFKTCMQNMAVDEDRYQLPDGTVVDRVPAFRIGETTWTGIVPRAELEKTLDQAVKQSQ